MGYYTSYKLDVLEGDPELIQQFIKSERSAEFALEEDGTTREAMKWYDHEDDLEKFSLSHPEALFLLSGEGEETGDIWRLYVRGGKSFRTKAVLEFGEFSEDKLS
jgi:hypothetical protein